MSMPAVIPALDASGPSTTKTRLSITCACGASVRERRQQLVMRGAAARAEQTGARGEQRARADRDQAMRRIRRAQRSRKLLVQPLRGRDDRRRDLARVRRRLADDHHPRRRAQSLRQRDRGPASDRPTDVGSVAIVTREAQPKARRLPAPLAMLVRQAKRLRRPGDVEQQRVRHDDEQNVDQMSACDHCRTWPGRPSIASPAARAAIPTSMRDVRK